MSKPISQSISERLLWVERTTGLARTALSRVAGLSAGHVGLIARGVHTPNARTAAKLARAFGVPPAWLLFGEGRPPSRARVREAVLTRHAALKDTTQAVTT